MSRNTALLLVLWNVVLTVAVIMAFMARNSSTAEATATTASEEPAPVVRAPRDTSGLQLGRIAFFFMDSVRTGFELVAEQSERFRSEGRRLEGNLEREMRKAQERYEQLMSKDHTYSTQSELQQDQAELQDLMRRIEELQERSQRQLARMEAEMLGNISEDIVTYLEEYNSEAGFDYIFSVEPGGQVWVGNPGLDITNDIVDGLNRRHRERKTAAGKK